MYLFSLECKHEIIRESVSVPTDGLVQYACFYSIELGKIPIQHDLLAADKIDLILDNLDWDKCFHNILRPPCLFSGYVFGAKKHGLGIEQHMKDEHW